MNNEPEAMIAIKEERVIIGGVEMALKDGNSCCRVPQSKGEFNWLCLLIVLCSARWSEFDEVALFF